MAQKTFQVNLKGKEISFFLTPFAFLFWVHVTVLAAPPMPNFSDDRRGPPSKELLDPSKEWRKPEEPKNQWRGKEPLKQKAKKSRIESKRFKPYYYDPEKEGESWDPYSSGPDKNSRSKPPTLFRFQF